MRAVVVGGGLAGAVAALDLAERGAAVCLVRAGPGATALSWGTLDVAAASPLADALPVRDPVRGEPLTPAARLALVMRRGGSHPYRHMLGSDAAQAAGVALVKEAAAALDGWLRPAGLRVVGDLGTTRWLADVRGALRGADLAFTGAAEGELGDASELAIVELSGLAGHDARPAARSLAAELAALELPARPVRVLAALLPPALLAPGGPPARLAARLEEPEALEALRSALAPLGAPGRLLLLPPVLGLLGIGRVLAALQEATGSRVGELVGAPPSSPAGLRLDAALRAALDRHGVEQRDGRAVAVERSDARATSVLVEREGGRERLEAGAVVLATGRFVGGGIVEHQGRLAESLLGLPLYDGAGQRADGSPAHRLVHLDYEAPQPLYATGVRTDGRLRPLAADGRPAFANLFAAGELLGGFDPARVRTGLGVALLTGRRAASQAAQALGLGEATS